MMNKILVTGLLLIPSLSAADALEDGKSLLRSRDYKAAIVQLEVATTTDVTGEALYCLGIAYELSGDTTKAIETYKKVTAGKSKRAADAERNQRAIESALAEASTVERARLEFERAGLESSTRLKGVRERIANAHRTIDEREREVKAKERKLGTENVIADEAKRGREQAELSANQWKRAALSSPVGNGRLMRALGTASVALAGIGVGASVWYARTASVATTKINAVTHNSGGGDWTDELEWYAKWGERADAWMPYSITAGAGLFLIGTISLGLGEAAADDPGKLDASTPIPSAQESR